MQSRGRFVKQYIRLPYFTLKSAIHDTIHQDGIEHAGYLAFLSILSLFPFLILLFSIVTYFSDSAIGSKFVYLILNNLPDHVAHSLSVRVDEIVSSPPQSILTIAIIGIIWTASSAVEGLRTILNRAYRVPSPPPYLMGRALSIVQFIAITLIISFTIILLILAPAILKKVEEFFSISFMIDYDRFYLRQIIIMAILFFTTSLLYYYITDVKQRYRDTLPGAFLSIILWVITLRLFTLYLEKFNQFNLLYGSLGGIIGALMFFYFVNLIFIIGAEFNYHRKRVSKYTHH
jgi:membrane protein